MASLMKLSISIQQSQRYIFICSTYSSSFSRPSWSLLASVALWINISFNFRQPDLRPLYLESKLTLDASCDGRWWRRNAFCPKTSPYLSSGKSQSKSVSCCCLTDVEMMWILWSGHTDEKHPLCWANRSPIYNLGEFLDEARRKNNLIYNIRAQIQHFDLNRKVA